MPPENTGASPTQSRKRRRKPGFSRGLRTALKHREKRAVNIPLLTQRPIALVGLMGVGKTTVGRRLAKTLELPFYDSDEEIEAASGRTVAGYFRDHGEAEFRAGERRVISRLLSDKPLILATGGGAFIPEDTRDILQNGALTIFLKGDFETLFTRVSKKNTRPLLQVEDPRGTYKALMDKRYPIYETAHITVNIAKGPHERTVRKVIRALERHYGKSSKAGAQRAGGSS